MADGRLDLRIDETGGPERGFRVISLLFGVIRAARLYQPGNDVFRRQLDDLLAVLNTYDEDEVGIAGLSEYFYVNGERLRPRCSQAAVFHALLHEFEQRGLGAIRFLRGVTGDEIESFARLFTTTVTLAQGERLPQTVQQEGLLHIVPVLMRDLQSAKARERATEDDETGSQGKARRTFWRAVTGTQSVLVRTAATHRPALRQARRVVQPIVDALLQNEYSLIGLTALKDHDEYTYAHCVNVSILSIRMGQVLGLSRATLANLGVASLLHDIGKVAVPAEVLTKGGGLDEYEWGLVRRHPIEGLKMIARMPGLSSLTMDAMRVSLQHHRNADGSGYPAAGRPFEIATLARIVTVADVFDAVTSHRAYRERPYTSYEALCYMLGPEQRCFDPAVLWALVESVGVYPAGTVLETASGHMVLSVGPNSEDIRRPVCRVVRRPGGEWIQDGELWEPLPIEDPVLRVVSPEEHGLDTNELLAA